MTSYEANGDKHCSLFRLIFIPRHTGICFRSTRVYAAILPLACYTSHFAFNAARTKTPLSERLHRGKTHFLGKIQPLHFGRRGLNLHGCRIEVVEKRNSKNTT